METFYNEPFTNFALEHNRLAFMDALAEVKLQWGRKYALLVNGQRFIGEAVLPSFSPADHSVVVGYAAQADCGQVERAIESAAEAFTAWKGVKPSIRARILYRAAALMRRRKHRFSAWLVYEGGKTWPEADAETAEAIDFLNYYAREAQRLLEVRTPLVPYPGEDNEWTYLPLGVGAVISPWNFPLAIMAGMTAAAIVCGNTVVLKPASAAPVIAAVFVDLLREAGLPDGIVQFVPGAGNVIGDVLAEHPLIRFINFTGSMEVGLKLNENANMRRPGQRWIKRVVAELGGKDGIVVDRSASITAAAEAIVQSAFGYGGQKCSACSRAIIHEAVHDDVVEEIVRLTGQLRVGDPALFETDVGPLIDRSAFEKTAAYVEIGRNEGTLLCGGGGDGSIGYYAEPTVIAGVSSGSRIAQEEIFGPLLAVVKAGDFEEALAIANDTPYGLTGALFSQERMHLERARETFHVGNLYLNRKCTGALVGVHPFGGFNLSGTDSKAGGPDYLLQFLQPKVVSERL
ncbi:1-pyrroline-5-carboxylate dehydrogenase 1 [Paenibacillus plantiphilus]|uniref:L-glutamate gamma-semialdehyde dehydrogenase n=1 Tax=Paenibacillus plantiphilus TaxID=2905650 RepID=A0ABN8G8D0_9BACL|nr:L-glutamate gamma-semialdehyde dehydrogenase [Paenibacillus plantiphilus]CAH1197900.1 1-pyrroline-5-carboxylate dehydrogenase 1 [Paenibacillus plantiphilus]